LGKEDYYNLRPARKLVINGVNFITDLNQPEDHFYIGDHLPDRNCDGNPFPYLERAPFRYFQRFSGGSKEAGHFGIDIEMSPGGVMGRYRMHYMNDTDWKNVWLAKGSRHSYENTIPPTPIFPPLNMTTLWNGTFYSPDANGRHVVIPERHLWMANMVDVVQYSGYQPFLRVYNSRGRTDEEMLNLMDMKWDDKNTDESLVMRTASFGHGRQSLDLCIREGKLGRPQMEMYKMLSQDMLIPIAILASYRARMADLGLVGRPTKH
jgi:hypothetical protein